MVIMQGRSIAKGTGSGELLVSPAPISFLSGVDPETGVIVEKCHPLVGQCIAGKILAFEFGKGSTVGSYVLYALSRNGYAPVAIVNKEAEPIIVIGAILGRIPMIDHIDISRLRSGVKATVNGDTGELSCEGEPG
jgi:hypothetical protein